MIAKPPELRSGGVRLDLGRDLKGGPGRLDWNLTGTWLEFLLFPSSRPTPHALCTLASTAACALEPLLDRHCLARVSLCGGCPRVQMTVAFPLSFPLPLPSLSLSLSFTSILRNHATRRLSRPLSICSSLLRSSGTEPNHTHTHTHTKHCAHACSFSLSVLPLFLLRAAVRRSDGVPRPRARADAAAASRRRAPVPACKRPVFGVDALVPSSCPFSCPSPSLPAAARGRHRLSDISPAVGAALSGGLRPQKKRDGGRAERDGARVPFFSSRFLPPLLALYLCEGRRGAARTVPVCHALLTVGLLN